MSRFWIGLAVLAALPIPPALHAQIVLPDKSESLPTFEVATVKPSSRDLGLSFHTHIWWDDNSFRTENTTLRDLIRSAFNIVPPQLTGGPDAQLDARWDINAKIGDDEYAQLKTLSRDDRNRAFHLMQQALLAERFGLRFHTETRELPVFNLVIDKSGFRLQPVDPADQSRSNSTTTNVHRYGAAVYAPRATLAIIIEILGRQPELDGRMVIDKTGLTGRYRLSLNWQPQRLTVAVNPTAVLDPGGPSLFEALREQTGLKLEPSKGQVPIIVVDAVSPLTPN